MNRGLRLGTAPANLKAETKAPLGIAADFPLEESESLLSAHGVPATTLSTPEVWRTPNPSNSGCGVATAVCKTASNRLRNLEFHKAILRGL